VRHLRGEGWKVTATRSALSWRDLALIGTLTLVMGIVLPIVGFPIGAWLGWWWRSRGVRAHLAAVLPAARAKVPPRLMAAGGEYAVLAGILLLTAAILAAFGSYFALLPVALVVVLVVEAMRHVPRDTARDLADTRVAALLEEARQEIDERTLDLDQRLVWLGEVESVEIALRSEQIDADAALLRAEDVLGRLRARPRLITERPEPVLEALRRGQSEPEPGDSR
jgi:hypothetical protein